MRSHIQAADGADHDVLEEQRITEYDIVYRDRDWRKRISAYAENNKAV